MIVLAGFLVHVRRGIGKFELDVGSPKVGVERFADQPLAQVFRMSGEFLDERVLIGSAMIVHMETGVLDDLRRDAAGAPESVAGRALEAIADLLPVPVLK